MNQRKQNEYQTAQNERTASTELKKIGNENSYAEEFFEELYKKIDLKNSSRKSILRRYIILAAQSYMRHYNDYRRELPSHEIKKELEKALNHLDKAVKSLNKVYLSGNNYGEDIVNNLHDVISEKHPPLHGILKEIRRDGGIIISPARSLPLLNSMAEGIGRTLKSYESRKTTSKSVALYQWIMIVSAQLEPAIERKLEQSRYHDGEYISKREITDSQLLQFIIEPLDPNVTISQIETAIKETRKERHEAPWDNYFPKG